MIEKNSVLRVNGEKASREYRSVKDALHRSTTQYEEEKKAFEVVMKDLEEKVAQTVHTREEEMRQRHHVQEQNTELRLTIDSLRSQVGSLCVLCLVYQLMPCVVYLVADRLKP